MVLLTAVVLLVVAVLWVCVALYRRRKARIRTAAKTVTSMRGHQKVAFILNPIKANAARARQIVEAECRMAGWDPPLILETTVADPGHSQVLQALDQRCDVVLVGGGDGAVRVAGQELARTGVPMGVIPLGTGNLLARNLDLDVTDLASTIRRALHGQERRIDMAWIELENRITGAHSSHSFLVIGGIGVDAKVVSGTRDGLKKRVGWLAYSESGLRNLPGRRQRISISIDDGPVRNRKVRSVLFANCGRLPGGVDFIPGAVLDDGSLDVVIMSPRTALGWAWMAGKIVLRHPRPIPVMEFRTAREVRISVTEPMDTQLDGDPTGPVTALSVRVDPGSLVIRGGGRSTSPEHQRVPQRQPARTPTRRGRETVQRGS